MTPIQARGPVRTVWHIALLFLSLALSAGIAATSASAAMPRGDVLPSLEPHMVAFYDFEHPVVCNWAQEADQGLSGTNIDLINGGADMRVEDGAYPGSQHSIQTKQVAIGANQDWKAGTYATPGVPTLRAFNHVQQATLMGWFKTTGENPGRSSRTNPNSHFNGIGLTGVLTGDSQGHDVRALLEVLQDSKGVFRVSALARRVDGGASQTFAANDDWQTILPMNQWVFLAATFDFNTGTIGLYKNGEPLAGSYAVSGDPWGIKGGGGPFFTTASDPRGIKIGGSYPQNTKEMNPYNGRMDSLMFLDTAVSAADVRAQYQEAMSVTADGSVGGTVPATLALTLGSPPGFGAFVPGFANDYTAQTTATVTSTAGDAALSVADPDPAHTGHLVNGSFALPSPLQARGRLGDAPVTPFADVGSSLNLLNWSGPVSNDLATLQFSQHIGASDALRTGTYAKTLVFTLSTTQP